MGNISILSINKKNKQARLTVPKAIYQSKGWKSGQKIEFLQSDSGTIYIRPAQE